MKITEKLKAGKRLTDKEFSSAVLALWAAVNSELEPEDEISFDDSAEIVERLENFCFQNWWKKPSMEK